MPQYLNPEGWPRGIELVSYSEGQGFHPSPLHTWECVWNLSFSGRPKPWEEMWIDNEIIKKSLRSDTWRFCWPTWVCMVAQAPWTCNVALHIKENTVVRWLLQKNKKISTLLYENLTVLSISTSYCKRENFSFHCTIVKNSVPFGYFTVHWTLKDGYLKEACKMCEFYTV